VTPFYRLVGPYRDPKASHVITTELWETITRRSIAVNMLVGLFPMVFYSLLSLMALCAEKALSLLRI
jgi:dimethylaniline monooxygenase (N-oxide forming)